MKKLCISHTLLFTQCFPFRDSRHGMIFLKDSKDLQQKYRLYVFLLWPQKICEICSS